MRRNGVTPLDTRALRFAQRFHALLLRMYPRHFRRAYGREMDLAFATLVHETYERNGGAAIMGPPDLGLAPSKQIEPHLC